MQGPYGVPDVDAAIRMVEEAFMAPSVFLEKFGRKVKLGPNSPLLTPAGARRKLQASEGDMQIALLELLVGRARPGEDRRPGEGLTGKYPELLSVYAIPNGTRTSAKQAKRAKAMGQLRGAPDLCLPVARRGYHALYVELKRPGEHGRDRQRDVAEMLRRQGNYVAEAAGAQAGLDAFLWYLNG